MNRRNRAALDDRGERRPMRVVKPGRLSRRLAVDQAIRPLGVELQHPVANDLERHPADPGRLRARRAFVNRRQSQKPPRLRAVLRSPRRLPHHLRIKISPKRNGHAEPPSFATVNQNPAHSAKPQPSHAFRDLVLNLMRYYSAGGASTASLDASGCARDLGRPQSGLGASLSVYATKRLTKGCVRKHIPTPSLALRAFLARLAKGPTLLS